MAVIAGLALLGLARGRAERAFWGVTAAILLNLVIGFGEDIDHHVYRIAALAAQIRAGEPSLLLTNPGTGETLPTFVYYSFVPYLTPVALNLLGLPAHTAFKIVMGLELIVMALGLRCLIERFRPGSNAGYLIAVLFLSANYVYGIWLQRMAFAEIWVYCLIPWVVLALARPNALMALTALLYLQIAGHPIVFAQAYCCSVLLALGLSSDAPSAMLRRCMLATLSALVLASPFWLPQFLWEGLIAGPGGLPARFADTFLSLAELFDRRYVHAVGFGLPLAVVLMIVLARGKLPPRTWLLVAAFVALLAVQTIPLRSVAERLPLLPMSLFVWRLMFLAAVLGAGALWAGWTPAGGKDRLLAGVTFLSLLAGLIVMLGGAPASLAESARPRSDETWYRSYLTANSDWGRREFLPDYSRLPEKCGIPPAKVQRVSFADLLHGVRARSDYVAIPNGPLPGISYSAPMAACKDTLILGPLASGAAARASQHTLNVLLYVRLAWLLLCAALFSTIAPGWRR